MRLFEQAGSPDDNQGCTPSPGHAPAPGHARRNAPVALQEPERVARQASSVARTDRNRLSLTHRRRLHGYHTTEYGQI